MYGSAVITHIALLIVVYGVVRQASSRGPDFLTTADPFLLLACFGLAYLNLTLIRKVVASQLRELSLNISTAGANQQKIPSLSEVVGDGTEELVTTVNQLLEKARLNQTELKLAREKAEVTANSQARFLATMSHEIRTPMNGVLGMLALALDSELNNEQRRFLNIAHSSAESLLTIINDVLDFSKIEAGQFEFHPKVIKLTELIDTSNKAIEIKATEKGLKLIEEISPEVPPYVYSDPVRLRQVLLNLVGNAIKFTEKGCVRVKLGILRESDGVDMLHFQVSDSGVGISDSEQLKVFGSYAQAHSTKISRADGTGLGLAICKRLVRGMGGRIWVESELGKGSNFQFTTKLEVSRLAPELLSKSSPTNRLPSLRLLLAEDDVVNQLVAESFLKMRLGHSVTVVENGAEAVEALKTQDFDAILMDMEMPVMDGLEATRVIRKLDDDEKRHIPIIALTAHAMATYKEKCLEAGMDGHVSKPIRIEDLQHCLSSLLCLNGHQHQQECVEAIL